MKLHTTSFTGSASAYVEASLSAALEAAVSAFELREVTVMAGALVPRTSSCAETMNLD